MQCRHVRTLGFGGHARKTQTFVVNVHRHTGCCRCTHMMMTCVESDADIYAHSYCRQGIVLTIEHVRT